MDAGSTHAGLRVLSTMARTLGGLAIVLTACATPVDAADDRAPSARSEEITRLEIQMEDLEAQLDVIYEKLDDYTVDTAPADILAERQRIEQELQKLHEKRTEALRAADLDSPTARRSLEPPAAQDIPPRRKPLANSIVKIGTDLVVRIDEIINGDAILLGGNLRVEGEVLGDVVVLGGDLEVTNTAHVGGQTLVVGGYFDVARGANIEGDTPWLSFLPSRGGLQGGWSNGATLFFDVFQFLLLFGLAAWFLLIHRNRFARAHEYMQSNRLRSFGLGVLVLTAGSFVLSVIAMLLLVTFIGIPVAGLLGVAAVVVLLAALFLGSLQMGLRVQTALRLRTGPRILSTCVGLLLVVAPEVIGDALAPVNRWAEISLDITSAILTLLALSLGLGALVMTRMGRRRDAVDLGESPTIPVPLTG